MKYLHAGMIQHDPSGNPAFLHRTAEGKVYPFNHGYRKVGYLRHLSDSSHGRAHTECWMKDAVRQPIAGSVRLHTPWDDGLWSAAMNQ